MEYLLAFSSTHEALKAESILKENDTEFRLLPAPKEIAAFCALVIGVKDSDTLCKARGLLEGSGGEQESIFKRGVHGYVEL